MNTCAVGTAAIADAATHRPRLLVVHDPGPDALALCQVLAPGHQVLLASAGEQPVALCESQRPDLVLLDEGMPGHLGHELCRRLKANAATRDIPVLLVTGQHHGPSVALGLNLGAADFITRPLQPALVLARVRTHLLLRSRARAATPPQPPGTLQAVLDSLPAHVAVVDGHGRITAVNAAWRRFANDNGLRSPDFGLGLSYPGLCDAVADGSAADAGRAAGGIRAVLDGQATGASLEYPCHSPTEHRWFQMLVAPLSTQAEGGATRCAVVMHVDISDRKRVEFAALLEQSDAMILLLDAGGRIETANPAYLRATGWSLQHDDPRVRVAWHGPLPQQATIRHRALQARSDGSSFTAEWSVTPIFGRDGKLSSVVCIGRDITREQQIELGLRENDKLRAVATLAGGIAHDFNNLLGSIMGLTELCAVDAPANSRLARNLGRIGQAGSRAAALVRQMLDFSRQTPMALHVLPASDLLAHARGLITAALPGNVTLAVTIAADGRVNMDLVQMEQALFNITGNAVHAMRQRGGEIHIVLDRADPANADTGTAPRHVRLRVIDSGEGIAPDVMNKIFEPFFTTKPVGEGTGLGLAVVHGIVASHGGVVEVASEVGAGSTFSLYLPLAGD